MKTGSVKLSVEKSSSPAVLASRLAEEIVRRIVASANKEKPFSLALSGGSTPALLYSFLFDEFAESIPWEFVHLFWCDERCVPPEHADSNYGMIRKYLIEKTGLSSANIHRMKGEEDPVFEAMRYAGELSTMLPVRDRLPVLDLAILGMGVDGHTASIFPDQIRLIDSERLSEVAVHPVSDQRRITLTGKIINNADAVVFLVTGLKKAHVVRQILREEPCAAIFPAYHIRPVYGSLDWYIDSEAASML